MIQRTLVLSALTLGIAAALLPLSCKSGAPPGGDGAASGKESPTQPGAPPGGEVATGKTSAPEKTAPAQPSPAPPVSTKPTEAAVPTSGRVEPSSSGAASSGPEKILPTTRRSAAGLPEALTGYISWFRLGPAPAAQGTSGAHAPACQTYVLFPKQEDHLIGGTVKPPLEKGTIIVLEEKEPGKDFISRIRTMTVEDAGWKFLEYTRDGADKAFAARSGAETQCATCHAKAKDSDSVYAKLTLE